MSLESILNYSSEKQTLDELITEDRVRAIMPQLRDSIAFFREYPDILVDLLAEGTNFRLYYYQRVFLRVAMRHRYVYCTFPRAYSKSFLSMLILILRAILYPNSHLFVTTGGKLIFINFNFIFTKENIYYECEKYINAF